MSLPTRVPVWINLAIICGLLVVYAAPALVNARADGFLVNDQGSKFLQIRTLVASRWQKLAIEYPGRVFDPAGTFAPLRQVFVPFGKEFVSIYLTPYLFLASILYAIGGTPGLYVISILAGAALVWLTGVLGHSAIDRRHIPLAMIAVGVASPLVFYATEFWEHAATAFLALAGLGLFISERRSLWFWSGVCWGIGAACRPETLLFGLATVAAAATLRLENWKARAVRASLTGLAALLPLGVYYQLVTGTWLGPQFMVNYVPRGYPMHSILRTATWLQTWWTAWPVRLRMIFPASAPLLLVLILGLLFILAARWFRRQSAGVGGIACVWAVAVSVLALQAVAQGTYANDVITSFPVAAFVAIAWLLPSAGHPHKGACAQDDNPTPPFPPRLWGRIVALFVPLALLIAPNAGGRQWGPRYLLPIFPLLALLSVYALDKVQRAGPRVLPSVGLTAFAITLAVSAGIQAVGLLVSVGRVGNTALTQTVRAAPEAVIIAEEDYIPMLAAMTFYDKFWFLAEESDDLDVLLNTLRARGETRLAYIVRDGREVQLTARLRAHGCQPDDSTLISLARPPLWMIHAACAQAAQRP